MLRRERVVVQIAVGNGRLQQFSERERGRLPVGHDHAAPAEDHRKARCGEERGRFVEAPFATGAAFDRHRPLDFAFDVAVEEVTRDVELRRPHLQHRAVERPAREFGHSRAVVDVRLELGDLREDRQLLGFLKAAQAKRRAAGLRRDHDDRRMRPEGGRSRGDEVGDARPVLRDAHAVPPGDARVAVGHVAAALLVRNGYEADSRERKEIERVHVRGPDDAKDVLHAIGNERFDERLGGRHFLFSGYRQRQFGGLVHRGLLGRFANRGPYFFTAGDLQQG